MSFITPEGSRCIMRPWGMTQCDCTYNIHGNATCRLGDISSECYKKTMSRIKSESQCNSKKLPSIDSLLSKLRQQKQTETEKPKCQTQPTNKVPQALSIIDMIWIYLLGVVYVVDDTKKQYYYPFMYP